MRRVALLILLSTGCGARERLRAGDRYLEQQRYAAAGRAYEKAAEQRPKNLRALEGAAQAWLAAGEPETALHFATAASDQGSPTGTLLMAEALLQLGRGSEALPDLKALPESTPGRAHALAAAYLAAGDLPQAAAMGRAALSSGTVESMALMAWLHARSGDAEDALSLAHRARSAQDPTVRADAAAVLKLLGDPAAAEEAGLLDEDTLTRWWRTAAVQSDAGDLESASRGLARLWAQDPTDPRYPMHLGNFLLAAEAPALARAPLEASIALDPDQPDTWRALAVACQKLQLARCEAEAWTGLLLHQDETTPADWQRAGRAWEATKDTEQAAALWREAVRQLPEDAAMRYALARALVEVGQTNAAIGHARLAWQLSPGDAEIGLLLGELYSARGEYDAAADIYRQAIRFSPQDARLRAGLQAVQPHLSY